MAKKFDNAQIYRVARYYYIENLSQNEIAQVEGISRSKVSRILDRARSSGMVSIDIKVPTGTMTEELQEKLKALLGIESVIVVPASVTESSYDTEDQLINDVASVAAAHIPELLKDAKVIGIGWGRTLYNTASYLPFLPSDPERTFVPLASNIGIRNRYLQSSVNVSRYGERFGAQTYYLNISLRRAHEPSPEAEKYNIAQIREFWDKMDAAIFSLGAPPINNYVYFKEEWTSDMFKESDLIPEAKGELLSQVFYSDGRPAETIGKDYVVIGKPLETLREVKTTVLVAAGNYKASPVYYAAKNKYMKTLICDHLLAEEILRLFGENGENSEK